jgi:NADH-quinone oxidoreductase subunit E
MALAVATEPKAQVQPKGDPRVQAIVNRWQGKSTFLIEILQDVQDEFRYIPREAAEELSWSLGVSLAQIYHAATFYKAFSLTPRGKHVVSVCTGTACHVKGSARILETLEKEIGVKCGETDREKFFSLEEVRCLGCCGLAAVFTVDKEVYGKVTSGQVPSVVRKYREEK